MKRDEYLAQRAARNAFGVDKVDEIENDGKGDDELDEHVTQTEEETS